MGDILIVDDEKDIRELVSDILIDEGYSTKLAANSEETFKSIEKSKPKYISWSANITVLFKPAFR